MTLPADEFLRRFLCHVLPSGFQRIRHYGLLASRSKHDDLARCRELLGTPTPAPPVKKTTAEWILLLLGIDVDCCPQCGAQGMRRTTLVPPHLARSSRACNPAPPEDDSS
jgi:Putative transposase